MATDTNRVADEFWFDRAEVTLPEIVQALAAQGLHVVTAADKAVLDAALDYHRLDTSVNEERLRHYCREAAK